MCVFVCVSKTMATRCRVLHIAMGCQSETHPNDGCNRDGHAKDTIAHSSGAEEGVLGNVEDGKDVWDARSGCIGVEAGYSQN